MKMKKESKYRVLTDITWSKAKSSKSGSIWNNDNSETVISDSY